MVSCYFELSERLHLALFEEFGFQKVQKGIAIIRVKRNKGMNDHFHLNLGDD